MSETNEATAVLKHIGVSPQKARWVIDQIRGKNVDEALTVLDLSIKAVSRDIAKLVRSAIANAENNNDLDIDSLYVKTATVDQGPTQKRMRPRAQGRGNTIRKRSSHITVVVAER